MLCLYGREAIANSTESQTLAVVPHSSVGKDVHVLSRIFVSEVIILQGEKNPLLGHLQGLNFLHL